MVLWIRNGELEDSYAFLVHLIILVWRELHLILDFHLVAGYMISLTWISVCFRASLPSTAFLRSSIIGWGCFTVKHIPYKCLHMPLYLKKKRKRKKRSSIGVDHARRPVAVLFCFCLLFGIKRIASAMCFLLSLPVPATAHV